MSVFAAESRREPTEPKRYEALVRRVFPNAEIVEASPLGMDCGAPDASGQITRRASGSGRSIKLSLRLADGSARALVFRVATRDPFGHEWRADRAAEQLLAFDTCGAIPDHAQPIDVGAARKDGAAFVSLRDAGEFYLLTDYAEGEPYALDLRRIARHGRLRADDLERCEQLADWMVDLHAETKLSAVTYRRTLRDVVGGGEGVFGVIDGYPGGVPGAHWSRLRSIEQQCVSWRWLLRHRKQRLRRIHGDFNPFNILVNGDRIATRAARGGAVGDPANDVACLAIHYVFFAFEASDPGRAWREALSLLWERFWDTYLTQSGDAEVLEVIAPYLTWRILILCNPEWYPGLRVEHREMLLTMAERALRARQFATEDAHRLFGRAPSCSDERGTQELK